MKQIPKLCKQSFKLKIKLFSASYVVPHDFVILFSTIAGQAFEQ